ncbi:MAG: hypothetical protein OEM02_00775 [Desulfobulbaceae bacterium]|nr:hypothetical protein [Desulfobulbaceae bacterium]
MNNYQTKQIVQTFSTVIISGILASTFLSPAHNDTLSLTHQPFTASKNYALLSDGTSPTYEPGGNFQTGYSPASTEVEVGTIVTSFFSKLSSDQEPLGSEFEQVLFENIWDLYQS